MIFYRMIAILSILFFTVYADENLSEIDTKIQECKNEKNGKSCYDAGQYFSKNQEENSSNQTLYYYGQGCKYNYQESCVEEVDYAIQKHFFLKRFTRKIVSVGDLFPLIIYCNTVHGHICDLYKSLENLLNQLEGFP